MKNTIVAIAIAGSLAVSLSAFANKGADYKPHHHHHDNLDWSKGWYIGAGVNGNAESTMGYNGSPEVFEGQLGDSFSGEVELGESNVGFDAYVGRKVSKHWAVELGYTWLGDQTFDVEESELEVYDLEVEQWNVHLVGIGYLPVGEYVNVFVKGGAAYFSTTQELETEAADVDVNTSTLHTMALTYGAGIELAWDNWGIRGEYNVIWPTSSAREDFYIADIISANIYYKFN